MSIPATVKPFAKRRVSSVAALTIGASLLACWLVLHGVVKQTPGETAERGMPRLRHEPGLEERVIGAGESEAITNVCGFGPDIQDVPSHLHLIRLWMSPAARSEKNAAEARRLISVLLDTKRFQEEYRTPFPFLVRTRYGARFAEKDLFPRAEDGQFRESHVGLTLSVLGEIGVSASTPIQTEQGPNTLHDVVNDLVANFSSDMEQDWPTVALAFYLPRAREWQNKFGEAFSFDGQVEKLASRPLGKGSSCAGTHTLYTLATLLNIDAQVQILSNGSRLKARQVLETARTQLEQSQLASGSWGVTWADGAAERHSYAEWSWNRTREVLVTGHHLDWMTIVPEELRVRPASLERAVEFVARQTSACDRAMFSRNVCPFTHGPRAIALLVRQQEQPRRTAK
jgi:hypothetical protein